MSNDRLKFSFMWQHQETGTWQDKRYTFGEVMNGEPYDDMSDNSLLKRYHHVATRQWTGLYDSEGVEIYENDKVSRGCEPFVPEYCGVVKFHHGCWMVMYDDEAHYFNLHFYVKQCKVTGNIYDA